MHNQLTVTNGPDLHALVLSLTTGSPVYFLVGMKPNGSHWNKHGRVTMMEVESGNKCGLSNHFVSFNLTVIFEGSCPVTASVYYHTEHKTGNIRY